jgi:hypothetical protein
MNYLKHYILIVRRAENRKEIDKKLHEYHHVFPVSIYGKNDFVVPLTLREHYIAHKLLWKIFKNRYGPDNEKTRKMAMAFHFMIYGKGDNYRQKTFKNSYLYESARIAVFESKKGKKRVDMIGKSYFGADEKTIREGIEKMRQKKLGMKINYPKNRLSSPCSKEKSQKISLQRKKTKYKYISMSEKEFNEWLSKQNYYAKDGRINSNITRAIRWRNEYFRRFD